MAISKVKAADMVPFGVAADIMPTPASLPAKSLTVKLDGTLYAELRDYCHGQEKATGSKLTHQQVMVEALKALLAKATA
jgi:hypothetical protein